MNALLLAIGGVLIVASLRAISFTARHRRDPYKSAAQTTMLTWTGRSWVTLLTGVVLVIVALSQA